MNDTTGLQQHETSDCLKTVGLDGTLLGMDADGLCLMELGNFDEVAGHAWADFWPAESRDRVWAAVHLSSRGEPAAQPFVTRFRERLGGLGRAITFVHPLAASDAPETPRTVKGLVAALASPYEPTGAQISIIGDDAVIGQHAATSLAMVLTELATNAVKYGALGRPDGELLITLERDQDDLILCWIEKSVLDPERPMTPGFGTKLLDRTIRSQLRGVMTRDWRADGLTVRMVLPLTCLAEQPGEDPGAPG